jgi:hypothetical protein
MSKTQSTVKTPGTKKRTLTTAGTPVTAGLPPVTTDSHGIQQEQGRKQQQESQKLKSDHCPIVDTGEKDDGSHFPSVYLLLLTSIYKGTFLSYCVIPFVSVFFLSLIMRIAYWRTELSCAIIGDAQRTEKYPRNTLCKLYVDTKNSVCIAISAHTLYLYICYRQYRAITWK